MNFTPMWSVNANSDLLFWEIAIPVMMVVIPLFLWSDFRRMGRYFEKRFQSRRIKKVRFCRTRARMVLCSRTTYLVVQILMIRRSALT